jgi:hypothetical protein
MAAWTEEEKVKIRAYLGFATLFFQQVPRLENAINAVQSQVDGGSLTSSATQDYLRTLIAKLDDIDVKRARLENLFFVKQSDGMDKAEIQPRQAYQMLERTGRQAIGTIARTLGFNKVNADYYSSVPVGNGYTDQLSDLLENG